MNKITKKKMKDFSSALRIVASEIDKYLKKGIPVEGLYSWTNTGIVDIPTEHSLGYKRFASLGGKKISFEFSFPNTKTIYEAIKENE